jgi:uracil-DNA glycosylase family 4
MGISQLRQHLESLAAAGVRDVPRAVASPLSTEDAVGKRPAEVAEPVQAMVQPAVVRAAGFLPLAQLDADAVAERVTALDVLQTEVAACTRCQELACSRTQTVFGTGHPAARICFFGEAPGADEDASGEPFVGKAGQLLTKIIEACRLKRDEVFILNVLKCRPPGNRRPLPEEVANCRRFFQRQLEIVSPTVICCLGATAAQALLETDRTIGKLRGQWHRYGSADVLCTYHPSYLLRNPAAKRDVWEDMKTMMQRLGVEL